MKKGKYTIADIAENMGISRSTVSKAMNGMPGVGLELRGKILEYIDEVGYRPNSIARSLSKGNLKIIGVILGDVRSPFYADLAFEIQTRLNEYGFLAMIFSSEYNVETELQYMEMAAQFNFAGLMLITANDEKIVKKIQQLSMPVVLVNRVLKNYTGDSVLVDNFQAGYIATIHLIELGHSEIGFIQGQSNSSAANHRLEGYRQALRNYNLNFNEDYLFRSDLKMASGMKVADEFAAGNNRPTGIVAVNDLTAIGFMERCREKGLRVPEDVSVVGVDDIIYASLGGIRLTTVKQDAELMGKTAVRLMMQRIETPAAPVERCILTPELIVRDTTCTRV